MTRKSLKSATDLIFGSHAQAEVIYFLLASRGKASAYAISSVTGIDHKTTGMMVKRLHKLEIKTTGMMVKRLDKLEMMENSENKTPIGIRRQSKLLVVLKFLFLVLATKRVIEHDGKTYWLLKTSPAIDNISRFTFFPIGGYYYDVLLAKLDNSYYGYVHNNDHGNEIENESLFIRSFLFGEESLVNSVHDISKGRRSVYSGWLNEQRKIFGTDENILSQIIKKHSEIIETIMNRHQKNV